MTGETVAQPGTVLAVVRLIVASVAIMGSPGPSTMSATAVGAAFGFRRSFVYVCGLILGTLAVLLAVAAGVMSMVLLIPHGAPVLLAVSSIYILYLAFRIATAPPLARRYGAAPAPAFAGGLLLAIANPKAYLAIGAVFAGTTVGGGDRALDAAVKTALLGAMIVIIHVCWLVAGSTLSRVTQEPVRSRIVNVLLAAVLIVSTAIAVLD